LEVDSELMGILRANATHLYAVILATTMGVSSAKGESTWVELTSYTQQSGRALVRIDDGAILGKIEIRIEVSEPSNGRVSSFFLNFLDPRPVGFAAAAVDGDTVTKVELDTKDLGYGENVNPSPSDRPKGLFDLGVAFSGSGVVTFTIDNPGGVLNCFSFGPFAARLEKPNGGAAKLYGVPVLPAVNVGKAKKAR
jgi:hypothetical protein